MMPMVASGKENLDHHLPVEASLDRCIKCNICVSFCPPGNATDLFPGPKFVGPQAARFRQERQPSPDASVDYCSGCRVCNMVCPTGVRIAEINARARAKMFADRGGVPLRNRMLGRSELLGKLGSPVAPLANFTLQNPAIRWVIDKVLGIDRRAPLPSFSFSTFRGWFKAVHKPLRSERKVVYFHGCSTNYYEPRVGKAAVAVLEHNGIEVIVAEQNCCGLPLLSNGEFDTARAYHEANVRKLLPYVRAGYDIVGTSTSCTLTLKEEAPELLDMYDADTQAVARHTFDIFEYLGMLYQEGRLKTDFKPVQRTLPYHPPCQLRAHRIGRPAYELLSIIPGLTLHESDALCCGIAGTYGVKAEKYDIAMKVGEPLFRWLAEQNQPLSVCDSETCRWQITHATGIPSVHPVEILREAYGL